MALKLTNAISGLSFFREVLLVSISRHDSFLFLCMHTFGCVYHVLPNGPRILSGFDDSFIKKLESCILFSFLFISINRPSAWYAFLDRMSL